MILESSELMNNVQYSLIKSGIFEFKTKNDKSLYSWFGNDFPNPSPISASEQATISEYMKFLDRRYQ